jgi:hypothetical protein
MEGVVIKTVEPTVLPGKSQRCIIKVKNKKFAEINPPAPETVYEKARNAKLGAVEKAYKEIERYINENRLNNLQSKIGPITNPSQINSSSDLLTEVSKSLEAVNNYL